MPNGLQKKSDSTRLRLIESAIDLLGAHDIASVSITDIARSAEVSSQAVYRYYSDKSELVMEAFRIDLANVVGELEESVKGHPLPALTGQIWRNLMDIMQHHTFANKCIVSREKIYLDALASSPEIAGIRKMMHKEIAIGQELGITRQDVDMTKLSNSFGFLFANVLMPMICEGKYNSPEWLSASHFLLASIFYPIPDFSTPEHIAQFEAQCARIGAEIASRERSRSEA